VVGRVTPVRADFVNPWRPAEDCAHYQFDRPQVSTPDGFVLQRTGGYGLCETLSP